MHDLLKRVKEIKKLRDKVIVNGALARNLTSQDDMEKYISIEIKVMMFHDVFLIFLLLMDLFLNTNKRDEVFLPLASEEDNQRF